MTVDRFSHLLQVALTYIHAMRFRVRNLFYLRLSSSDVIPLYLYLDERHVDWMSERTLQAVVADLRPLIGPKLEAERYAHYGSGGPANAKKGTVEVHRGGTYQFAYFIRKAEPHSIVFKARNYVMVNRTEQSSNAKAEEAQENRENTNRALANERRAAKGTKRPRKPAPQKTSLAGDKKGKGKAKAIEVIDDQGEDETEDSALSELDSDSDVQVDAERPSVPRRSTRRKKQRTAYREISDDESGGGGTDDDIDMQADGDIQVKQEMIEDEPILDDTANADDANNAQLDPNSDNPPPPPPDFSIDIDEEEEEEKKSKPVIQLSFRSLNMHDRCLCVVVEPWPALPAHPTRLTPGPSSFPAPESASEEEPGKRGVSLSPSIRGPRFERAPSVVSLRFSVAPETDRGETPLPLFLPDASGRDRSATPAPARFPSEFTPLHTIDNAQYSIEEDDDNFGMMAFSQVLNNVSGDRIGAAEEDDEMDGGALYGDADEIRGTI